MKNIPYRVIGWCPGAIGLWLRQKMFPSLFRSCGKGVLFGRFLDIIAPENIVLGNRVVLNNSATLDASCSDPANTGIQLEDDVFIGTNTEIISGKSGAVTIRSGANFSSFCTVRAEHPVVVGENVLVAAYCTLGCNTDSREIPQQTGLNESKEDIKTNIGSGCWLGVRMKVAEGVSIGADTIIGAHAVVESDVPSMAVAVGHPARMIRDRQVD